MATVGTLTVRLLVLQPLLLLLGLSVAHAEVDFSRDIRPILSDRCYACHGFDDQTREADVGLHTFEAATSDLGGYQAIRPGSPELSEIIARMASADPDEVMPPADSNKPALTEEELAVFRQWIQEGAKYETHWSFLPPEKPKVPSPEVTAWREAGWRPGPATEIDRFVWQRLQQKGMQPASQANKATLLRRVSFDLTGLPPTSEELQAFLADRSPEAYEKAVDRLLASSAYGERWARHWLDLARYADTNGYEKDRPRSIWPYRDWVIRALNADMPFDQFSIEQLAGDMLPDATLEQRVATGFHRNTMLNEEGGIDPLEFRFHAMVDRVATTGTVWMGLTTGCAQCHTHKFDPITHTDYFGMMALLNNADELEIEVPDAAVEQRQQQLRNQIDAEETRLLAEVDEAAFASWWQERKQAQVEWQALEPTALKSTLPKLVHEGDGVVFSSGDFQKRDVYTLEFAAPKTKNPITALRLEVLPDDRLPRKGPGRAYYEGRSGDFFLSELTLKSSGEEIAFSGGSQSYGKISVGSGKALAANLIDGEGSTGWSTSGQEGSVHEVVLNLTKPLAAPGPLEVELLFERHFVAGLGKFRLSFATQPDEVAANPHPEFDAGSATEAEARELYVRVAPAMKEAREKLAKLERAMPALPTTLAFEEWAPGERRETHRRHRGEYLNVEERVEPAVPAVFSGLPEGSEADRLGFARWLVDAERNPLVARVFVNRVWFALFGRGFVPSLADFGLQSELPSHPDLLDWLAVTWVEEDGWSMKKLHKRLVMSATYRQQSHVTAEQLASDPSNTWLARGPRFRLDAEMIRDAVLRVSGLLSPKLGGPSVYPPQPASVTEAAYGRTQWNASSGDDRYRRSLYTFSKRTAPFAAYLTFDGPTGEACIAQRERSNTPLQALTLMNDPMFGEGAQALASRFHDEGVPPGKIARQLFQAVLCRVPDAGEVKDLVAFHRTQLARFKQGELDPAKVGGEGASAEQAAWSLVARALFNLDEFVTKG